MRNCAATTASLLAAPPPGLKSADLFTFTLLNGTVYRWTSYDRAITAPDTFDAAAFFWRYKVISRTDNTDYSSPSYDDSAWSSGPFPIGNSVDAGVVPGFLERPSWYGFADLPGTNVPRDDRVWARAHLSLGSVPSSLRFQCFVDDTADLYFNGTLVTTVSDSGGFYNDVSVSTSALVVGDNVIAVRLTDTSTGQRIWLDWRLVGLTQQTWSSRAPWLKRSKLSIANTMQVPTLSVELLALDDSFAGGADIKAQITNGLFDGAQMTLVRQFFTSADGVLPDSGILLFGGPVGNIEPEGSGFIINVKGKSNQLNQYAPRNLYQLGCQHAFCDVGCTLSRASFTTPYTVGSSPTRTFIPWSGSPPGNASNYRFGTITFTSGACAGQARTDRSGDSSGLTLIHPLNGTPTAGDGFTAFEGCDKALNSGSGQDCTARSNTQNWRAFPFVPPADTAF